MIDIKEIEDKGWKLERKHPGLYDVDFILDGKIEFMLFYEPETLNVRIVYNDPFGNEINLFDGVIYNGEELSWVMQRVGIIIKYE